MTYEHSPIPQPESGRVVREDILARIDMDAFMTLLMKTQDQVGYLLDRDDDEPLSHEPLRELDAMMHISDDGVEVIATGAFTICEADSDEAQFDDGGLDRTYESNGEEVDDIIGDGNPHRLFEYREPVVLSEVPLVFQGANYGSDRNGMCQIVFDFYAEAGDGQVQYEAVIGDLWSLEEVIEEDSEWTDATSRISSRAWSMAENELFFTADALTQRQMLYEQCLDARTDLAQLIDEGLPVAVECVQYYEAASQPGELDRKVDQADLTVDEQVAVTGVILDVIYPELLHGSRTLALRSVDDFTHGDGTPCLLVRSDAPDGSMYFVPTGSIRSLDRQDTIE